MSENRPRVRLRWSSATAMELGDCDLPYDGSERTRECEWPKTDPKGPDVCCPHSKNADGLHCQGWFDDAGHACCWCGNNDPDADV